MVMRAPVRPEQLQGGVGERHVAILGKPLPWMRSIARSPSTSGT